MATMRSAQLPGGPEVGGGLPEDPGRPPAAAAGDGLPAGDDQVRAEVVGGLRQRLIQHLQRVDGGGHYGVLPDQAGLGQQGELQVGEAAALARAGALAVDSHAATHHQVHRCKLGHADPPPGARRTGDGGGAAGWEAEALGVEFDEGTLVGQAGHGHVHQLAVGQRACPDRELGGVAGLRQSRGMHPMSGYACRRNLPSDLDQRRLWRWLVMWASDE
jgi:hypothetical protein